MSLAWVNGTFQPLAGASLPLTDAGFATGATVVDNARTYGRALFRWRDHLARFRRDCDACFVPLAASDAERTAAAQELIAAHAGDVHVVTFATPETLGMLAYPVPEERNRAMAAEGVALAVVGHQTCDGILSPRVKHRSRMLWWLADHLPRPPGTTAILTDRPGGTLTETATANFLAVVAGVVCTPPRAKVLDGISVRVVEELCAAWGVPFEERELRLADVPTFQEAMLAGTGFGVVGVRDIDGVRVPWPGELTARLRANWHAGSQDKLPNTAY